MGLLYVVMDGVEYQVPVEYPSLTRSFDFLEGRNAGIMQSGLETLDTIGTRIGYSLHIPAQHKRPTQYDAFFEAISSPDREHYVTLPYGQTTLSFFCKVEGGSDTLFAPFQQYNRWGDLTVRFTPTSPQRTP